MAMDPSVKFRSLKTRKSTTGSGVYSSQPTAPQTLTAAMEPNVRINGDENQSSSSPRSSMIWKAASPTAR